VTPPELPTQQGPAAKGPATDSRKRKGEADEQQGRDQRAGEGAAGAAAPAAPGGKRRKAGPPATAAGADAPRMEELKSGSPDLGYGLKAQQRAVTEGAMPAWMAAGAPPVEATLPDDLRAANEGGSMEERPPSPAPRAAAATQRPRAASVAAGHRTPGSAGRLGKMQAASQAPTQRTYERQGSFSARGADTKQAAASPKAKVGSWGATVQLGCVHLRCWCA
jgi:hypothetical protein